MTFEQIYAKKDIIARDLTGSGKTLGFCLPMVERLRAENKFATQQGNYRSLKAIVLAPTRELALQVSGELEKLKHSDNEYKVLTVYGGTSINDQTYKLRNGVDFFVGTCGRVMDHIERGNIDFQALEAVILDEADQMLDMGF